MYINMNKGQQKLIEYMQNNNISEKDMAIKIGVDRSQINRYLHGNTPRKSIQEKLNPIIGATNEWLEQRPLVSLTRSL